MGTPISNIIPAIRLHYISNEYVNNQTYISQDHYVQRMINMGYAPTGARGFKLDVGQKNNALAHTFAMAKIS